MNFSGKLHFSVSLNIRWDVCRLVAVRMLITPAIHLPLDVFTRVYVYLILGTAAKLNRD